MTAITSLQNRAKIKEIQEIAIALAIKDFAPEIITEEFVRQNKIVNADWKLNQAPFEHHDRAQLAFDSNVTIVAQKSGIAFIERISNKDAQLQAQSVADKCVTQFTGAEYQGMKLEAKRLIPIPNDDATRSYLTEFLVASGAWQNYGQAPVKTGINFLYNLGRCQLNMAISEATIKQENKQDAWSEDMGGLLFAGTFKYPPFDGDNINQSKKAIANCTKDWQEFNQIIDRVFLNSEDSLLQRILFE
ncbi:MAG: hypothetical protein AAFO95_06350 [Cyanobacteria bacterium J06600_6]